MAEFGGYIDTVPTISVDELGVTWWGAASYDPNRPSGWTDCENARYVTAASRGGAKYLTFDGYCGMPDGGFAGGHFVAKLASPAELVHCPTDAALAPASRVAIAADAAGAAHSRGSARAARARITRRTHRGRGWS